MYRFVIVDDEQVQQNRNKELVEEWAQRRKLSIKVACFSSAEAFLFYYDEDKSCDVILLDIEMEGLDGVSLAREVRAGKKGFKSKRKRRF